MLVLTRDVGSRTLIGNDFVLRVVKYNESDKSLLVDLLASSTDGVIWSRTIRNGQFAEINPKMRVGFRLDVKNRKRIAFDCPGVKVTREELTFCVHDKPAGQCDACDRLGDFAFDADREQRFFGR